LVGSRTDEAIARFQQSINLAESLTDATLASWSRLFIGKAKIRSTLANIDEGESLMRNAATLINETGEQWEKEEVAKILATVGIQL
jgi:hypothetical protein